MDNYFQLFAHLYFSIWYFVFYSTKYCIPSRWSNYSHQVVNGLFQRFGEALKTEFAPRSSRCHCDGSDSHDDVSETLNYSLAMSTTIFKMGSSITETPLHCPETTLRSAFSKSPLWRTSPQWRTKLLYGTSLHLGRHKDVFETDGGLTKLFKHRTQL